MSWNDGYERRKFQKEQEKNAIEYRNKGMSEFQIQQMYEFDLEEFKRRRREAMHVQPIEPKDFNPTSDSEEKLSLYAKYPDVFTCTIEDEIKSTDRYAWINEIKNEKLKANVLKLSIKEKELITLYVFEEKSQAQIGVIWSEGQRKISREIEKIRKFLKK